jgi:adenine-specific DNA-methyltransferase
MLHCPSTYSSLVWLVKKDNASIKYLPLNKNLKTSNDLSGWLSGIHNSDYSLIDIESLNNDGPWIIVESHKATLMNKIKNQPAKLLDVFDGVYQGVVTGDNNVFYLKDCRSHDGKYMLGYSEATKSVVKVEKALLKPLLTGDTIDRYTNSYKNTFLIYPYYSLANKTQVYEEDEMKQKFPKAYEYLYSLRDRLKKRGTETMKYPRWYSLWNPRTIPKQESKLKILTPDICYGCTMYCDENGEFYHNDTSYAFILKKEYESNFLIYYAILNSKLLWFYLQNSGTVLRGSYFRFKTSYLKYFAFPNIKNDIHAQEVSKLVNGILSKKQKDPYADTSELENKIDRMVYDLYGLTDEEIEIVEGKGQ